MNQAHIVIVDDEEAVRQILQESLTEDGYQVTAVADGAAALQVMKETPVQVLITDLKMPDMDGFKLLEHATHADAQIACIVMTGYGTIEYAVRAMKAGAYDFITKPIRLDAVSMVVKKAVELQRLKRENVLLRRTAQDKYRLDNLIGTLSEIHEFIDKVADTDSTVLIQGESGTGKELVARMLHFNSVRRDRPLVPVNCGAIPENLLESELFGHEKGAFTGALAARVGRFEMAHGGTIFLDEIGEMSMTLQVKLLRVLQERCFERVGGSKTIRVDVRIVAATNQDLEVAVQEKRFRKDLYYRLNVIPMTIPPLRDRRGDIPLLVEHFLYRFNQTKQIAIDGIEPDAMECLVQYSWPGNVRELENMMERVTILKKSGRILRSDLPPKIAQSVPMSDAVAAPKVAVNADGINLVQELERFENRLIIEALRQTNGVTSKAAQLLHLNRTTLVEKLKRKGFDAKVQGELYS
ncbi:MAG TPA: sigma-54 dependent transcriptional regulator [Nitrospirales bacterium]|nr:sigma-54 dependent transcriptional regulator [Nitrospirales bacterium]